MRRRSRLVVAVAETYATTVGGSALSLVSVLITSRALGPDGRGTVVFLTTVTMLTAQLATLGVEEAAANLTASRPRLRGAVAGTGVLLAALLGLAAAGILLVGIAVVPRIGGGAPAVLRVIALAAIPVLILQHYLAFVARAEYAFRTANTSILIGPTVNFAVNGGLFAAGVITVETAVLTWVAGQALATAYLAVHIARGPGGFARPDAALARSMLGFGARAHIGRVMMTGNYRLDQWILGAVSGSREVGLYSVAVAWSEVLFFLPDALSLVLRPDLARASEREAGRQTAAVLKVALGMTLVAVVAIILAAPLLCVTVFGSAFRGSIDDLRLLVCGALGMVALKTVANALLAQRRPARNNIAIGASFLVVVVLDVLLIPAHGGSGAAAASTAGYTVGGIVAVVILARTLHLSRADLISRRSSTAPAPAPGQPTDLP